MQFGWIDWDTSIEQQVDEISAIINDACVHMQQIRFKGYARPEVMTDEAHSRFESVICSMHDLITEFEENPLYRRALLHVCVRRMKEQQTSAKYFGVITHPKPRSSSAG